MERSNPYQFQLIDTAEVMSRLGYTNVSSFHRARKAMGFKGYWLNNHRLMFDEKEVFEWVKEQKERSIPHG